MFQGFFFRSTNLRFCGRNGFICGARTFSHDSPLYEPGILDFQKAIGLPTTLAEVGVDFENEDDINRVAIRSVAPGETSHHEPFEVSAEAVADALRAADSMGRQH